MIESEKTLWGNSIFSRFPTHLKEEINEEQGYKCARCGVRVRWLEGHHIVPEKALLRRGIKGRDNRSNAVGLCGPEYNDCHEEADMMAIRRNLFFKNGEYVPLSQINPNAYQDIVQTKRRKSKRRR